MSHLRRPTPRTPRWFGTPATMVRYVGRFGIVIGFLLAAQHLKTHTAPPHAPLFWVLSRWLRSPHTLTPKYATSSTTQRPFRNLGGSSLSGAYR
jgi:hypothetical protein